MGTWSSGIRLRLQPFRFKAKAHAARHPWPPAVVVGYHGHVEQERGGGAKSPAAGGVIDRIRLEEMPSHRRRLEDAAGEVTGRKWNTGMLARQTMWQVKTGEASDNQGST